MRPTVLGFVEDPGSANFFVGLRAGLAVRGVRLDLRTSGTALTYLQDRGESPTQLPCSNAAMQHTLDGTTMLLVGTSENRDSPAFTLMMEARRRNLSSVAIVDSPASVVERFCSNGTLCDPDYVISAQEEACDQAMKNGIPLYGTHLVRHPYLDDIEKLQTRLSEEDRHTQREILFGVNGARKKVIVFLSEISDGLAPDVFRRSLSYSLQGWGTSDKRTHIVLQEIIDAIGAQQQVHLVMRLHPKDNMAEYKSYANRVDQFSQNQDAREIVYFADAVVGMTTNLISEAAVMGVPVLSVVPRRQEKHWLAQMTKPPVEVVCLSDDLPGALSNLLSAPVTVRQRIDLDRPELADVLARILELNPSTVGP